METYSVYAKGTTGNPSGNADCNVLKCQVNVFNVKYNQIVAPSLNTARRSAHQSRCVFFFISLICFLCAGALQTTFSENGPWTTVPSLSNVNLCT